MDQLTDFLRQMPKIELHVHLESTMPGWLLECFAVRQGRTLPRAPEELYHCSAEDLSDFLGFLDRICSYVGTTADLAEAAEHFSCRPAGGEHSLRRGNFESYPLASVLPCRTSSPP